jgi:hypothetical protein
LEFFLEKMSNLNDYEDKEIIIDDEKVADSNSNKKKAIFPWILTFAYEFDDIKVLVIELNEKLVAIWVHFV